MGQYRYAIVCPARWESESICEWLLYHRAIGFEHAYIYCNDDDPNELFDRTAIFREGPNPFVTFIHYPFQGLQWDIYLHWFRNFASEVEWIAFIDADEFLVLPSLDDINQFVSGFPAVGDAIHFHWLFYGTSGYLTRPEGSVLRQYTRRAPTISHETKTMVRAQRVDVDLLRREQLPIWHLWTMMHVPDIRSYTSCGVDITQGYDRERHSRENKEAILRSGFVAHFALRSEADFKRRLERGISGQFAGQALWAKQLASGEAYGFIKHTNEVEDFYLRDLWCSKFGEAESTRLVEDVRDFDFGRGRVCLQSSSADFREDSNLALAAGKAVSGVTTGRAVVRTSREFNPWWRVDLGELRLVKRLRVSTRTDDRNATALMNPLVIETSSDATDWVQQFRRDDPHPFGGADGHPLLAVFDAAVTARYVRIRIEREGEIALDRVEVYGPALAEHRISVVSFYMDNIPASVVLAQAAIVRKFLPPGFVFRQVKTTQSHYESLDSYMKNCGDDVTIFLDIDCVPLHSEGLSELASFALQGRLVGCVQRASHIDNAAHLYVGPFCLALTKVLWEELGCPSFMPTAVGDVGEQLTYACEEKGVPVTFIWPSKVDDARWPLTKNKWFGLNAEYGQAFFHAFSIREDGNREKFLEYCRRLSSESDHRGPIVWGTGAADETVRSLEVVQPVHGATHMPTAIGGPLFSKSDKSFWHRFTNIYEDHFHSLETVDSILEFGVFEGNSIRWLCERFPSANIVGADIVPLQDSWPRSPQVSYLQVDQGKRGAVNAMFRSLERQYDLIIEDGSHIPEHQVTCFVEGFPYVKPGKLYIVEDIHTSHPANQNFREQTPQGQANILNILLCYEHLKVTDQILTIEVAEGVASDWISAAEIQALYSQVESVSIFSRSTLPCQCFACGSDRFNYVSLKCQCGVDLYSPADSMMAVVTKKIQ